MLFRQISRRTDEPTARAGWRFREDELVEPLRDVSRDPAPRSGPVALHGATDAAYSTSCTTEVPVVDRLHRSLGRGRLLPGRCATAISKPAMLAAERNAARSPRPIVDKRCSEQLNHRWLASSHDHISRRLDTLRPRWLQLDHSLIERFVIIRPRLPVIVYDESSWAVHFDFRTHSTQEARQQTCPNKETSMREIVRPVTAALGVACLAIAMTAASTSGAFAQAKQQQMAPAAKPRRPRPPPLRRRRTRRRRSSRSR